MSKNQQRSPDSKQLIEQTEQMLPPTTFQRDIIDLIETIVIYKLPQASREEISQMLGRDDLKQTRFYQEAFAEGRQEGRQEVTRNIVKRLANLGNNSEDIAEIVGLSVDEIQQILESSKDG